MEAKITTNHDEIKKWAEERAGNPAVVKGTGGVLRINFPGYGREGTLEDISWDDFFKKFEEKQLAFLYQDKTSKGETSRFNKFISRK